MSVGSTGKKRAWDFLPEEWLADGHNPPAANDAHMVPIAVRRAFSRPIGNEADPDLLRLHLLSTICDGIWLSPLLPKLREWDGANERIRKSMSHYGACIARTYTAGFEGGPYTDEGNAFYALTLGFIGYIAQQLGEEPILERAMKLKHEKDFVERAGDVWEATIGEVFEGREECSLDADWWLASWRLDQTQHSVVVRLLLITAMVQRVQASTCRIADRIEIIGFFPNIDRQLALLKERHEGKDQMKRRRSIEGDAKSYERSKARMLARQAKGKGKGKKGKDAPPRH